MSGVAEVTAFGNQQQKRQPAGEKALLGLFMRPQSSQQIGYPDLARFAPKKFMKAPSDQGNVGRLPT